MISISPSSHQRKAWDSNPHDPKVARFSKPARRAVSGYLPYSSFIEWSHRELNPDFRNAIAVSSRWTMTPSVERRGIEPRLPGCKPSVFPLDQRPVSLEVRPGIEPGLRPYHRRVQPEHLQTKHQSDRGWNRTIDLLVVTQASLPLDHAINQ